MIITFIIPHAAFPTELEKKYRAYITRRAALGFTTFYFIGGGNYAQRLCDIATEISEKLETFRCFYVERGQEKKTIRKSDLVFLIPDPEFLDLILYADEAQKHIQTPDILKKYIDI